MRMVSCAIAGFRPPERQEFGKRSIGDSQGVNVGVQNEMIRFVRVRDYKDRSILHSLQLCARSENPGFIWFDEKKDRAKLAWLRRGRDGEAVGYCISREGRYEYSAHARGDVYIPRFISQIFVVEGQRRRSIASMMINDFVSEGGADSLWVESPKRETVELLHKLGYRESRERYQLWEMMFGLTCWARNGQMGDALPLANQELTSADCYAPWLWSGDNAVGMATLR